MNIPFHEILRPQNGQQGLLNRLYVDFFSSVAIWKKESQSTTGLNLKLYFQGYCEPNMDVKEPSYCNSFGGNCQFQFSGRSTRAKGKIVINHTHHILVDDLFSKNVRNILLLE